MKHSLIPLLLCLTLLCGCAAQNSADSAAVLPAEQIDSASDPGSVQLTLLEGDDSVRRFRFSETVTGFLPLGENLLFFTGTEPTVLTLLEPYTFQTVADHAPGFTLTAENASVQLLENGISYFNSTAGETVVLDNMLGEVHRIPAPEDLIGIPLLSRDGSTLYYCTPSAIRAMNPENRISRILKEASYPVQSLTGLLLRDSILQVSITDTDGQWRTLFLSSENGRLLQESEGNILPQTDDTHYLLQSQSSIFCGKASESPSLFLPRLENADCFLLPDSFQAITAAPVSSTSVLEIYDLTSGLRSAELILPELLCPKNVTQDSAGSIWFLTSEEIPALYCWNPSASAVSDDRCYTAAYYTRSEPDYDGLAACSLLAEDLSQKYGIEILIYKDAVLQEPWDYHLEYAYQTEILQRELENLDQNLRVFPDGFLKTLADRFTALKICIVQSIEGSPESGNTDPVNGIQFMDGFDAYIVLAAEYDTTYSLYHELSHLMETVILTESTAYDRWELLNPEGFRYDNDYAVNRSRDGQQWLQPGKEYFIDTYAMSYAKEDRARLLEYAMTDGHAERFRSVHLQQKLRQMCLGIRDAFGLKNVPETFLWEQYLDSPLSGIS